MTSVTFNNLNLQSGNYFVTDIKKSTSLDNYVESLTYRDGILPITQRSQKIDFVLSGIIKGTSQADCETNIDTFTSRMYQVYNTASSAFLDIDWAGSTRRYQCAVLSAPTISRDRGQISFANFELALTGITGYGQATSLTTQTYSNLTTASSSHTYSFVGDVAPRPVITINIDSASSMTYMRVTNQTTNTRLTLTRIFTAGEAIVIDCDRQLVTIAGVEIANEGVFPEFVPGSNTLLYEVSSASHQIDIQYDYYARYV